MDDKVKIYSSSDVFKINVLHAKLTEAGLSSYILNQQDSSYLTFGQIHLYIDSKDLDQAKLLLTEDA